MISLVIVLRAKQSLPGRFSGALPLLQQLHGRGGGGGRGGVGGGAAGRLQGQRGRGGRHQHVEALQGVREGSAGLVLGTQDVTVWLVDFDGGHSVQALQAQRGGSPHGVAATDGPEFHRGLVHVDVQDLVGVLVVRQILQGLFQLAAQGLEGWPILWAQEPAGKHQGIAGEDKHMINR